ncbi:MAG: TIGR03118 family protein [Actinomycetes bacterium]
MHAPQPPQSYRSPSGSRRRRTALAAGVGAVSIAALVAAQSPASASPGFNHHRAYVQTNLVSDVPGWAALTDPNLVNAWGLSQGAATPLWVSDNGTDVTTLYTDPPGGSPAIVPLVVKIPGGAPTGQVFNDTTGFALSDGSPAFFVFASEAGKVTAWNPGRVPITLAEKHASNPNAIYKGITLVHGASGPFLLAADFHSNRIRAFDSSFMPMALPSGAFSDPTLPADYAPFNVTVVGTRVFVSYAKQKPDKVDDASGPGHGFIDVYGVDGKWQMRFASRGVLNSPWGMTVAPAGFGPFAGDLLVGNFGDGRIHAFNQWTGHLDGTLRDGDGHPIVIDGLWGLLPGNGTSQRSDAVWFSAGPEGESHGLLGTLTSATATG